MHNSNGKKTSKEFFMFPSEQETITCEPSRSFILILSYENEIKNSSHTINSNKENVDKYSGYESSGPKACRLRNAPSARL